MIVGVIGPLFSSTKIKDCLNRYRTSLGNKNIYKRKG